MKAKAGLIALLLVSMLGIASAYFWLRDPCLNLDPCDQYKCRNPQFYCAQTLYESNTPPLSVEDAQQIVRDYADNELGSMVEIITSFEWGGRYNWYQITVRFDDGSENGYEVGPDGSIYEIKRLN